MPYLANVNVRWGEFALDALRTMRFEPQERDRYGLKYGDIIMCEGGEPGRCAIWKEKIPGMMIQKALHRIRPKDVLDYRFLYYSLLCIGNAKGFDQYFTGATIKHLPGEKLAKVEVDIPPLPIQRRIAGILSAYDDLIENSQRRIKILESMARALYREWFVHFRFPGHESTPRIPSPLGEIPQGWEVRSLAELMDIRGGSQPPKSEFVYEPKDGYVRLIQIRDYESDGHLTFVRESPRLRMVERTEIMIARYGASVARICSGLTGAYNVALAKVIPTAPNCQEFLRQYLSDDEFQKLLIGMSGRAAQNGFNKSDIAAARVPVPADGCLLEQFERFAVPIRDSILGLRDQIQNLRRTRDLLLPRLLSGQIDVANLSEPVAA